MLVRSRSFVLAASLYYTVIGLRLLRARIQNILKSPYRSVPQTRSFVRSLFIKFTAQVSSPPGLNADTPTICTPEKYEKQFFSLQEPSGLITSLMLALTTRHWKKENCAKTVRILDVTLDFLTQIVSINCAFPVFIIMVSIIERLARFYTP